MLCALCISMFQGLAENTEGDHHASFEHLTLAAKSGCRICKGLCRLRDDFGPDEVGELCTDPFLRFRYYHYGNACPIIEFFCGKAPSVSQEFFISTWLSEENLHLRMFELHLSGPIATPDWWSESLKKAKANLLDEPWRVQEDKHLHRYIPSNTGDPEVLKLALEWLMSCDSDHETCEKIAKSPTTKRYYPPRLLDVAPSSFDIYHLLIVENASLDDTGYVALSHCWGENPSFLTLTTENMVELQHGVLASSLPKSFVDSIQISRKLGFRYIWIDSLCVIQSGPGSEADWQIHSATMDLIYANCDLNVAVSCAANAQEGAFVKRDPDFIQPAHVHVTLSVDLRHTENRRWSDASSASTSNSEQRAASDEENTTNDEDMNVAVQSQLVTIFMGQYDFSSSLWELPLQKRGWVVQERIMAPRTIYFGKDRVYWECNEKLLNEHLPWGTPLSGELFDCHYKKTFSLPYVVANPPVEALTDEAIESLHLDWHSIVQDYSDTELTFPDKDKLVAIAALATRYGRVFQSPYEAGLFQSDFPLGLLWTESLLGLRRSCTGNEWTYEQGWQEPVQPNSRRSSDFRAPTWSWASVDGRVNFHCANWGYGQLSWWQESQRILASVVKVNKVLVDVRNPYGQLASAAMIIEGPISAFEPFEEDLRGLRIEPQMHDTSSRLFAFHILEENRKKKNGDIQPNIYGLVLSSSDLKTYKRIGCYHWEGPVGSRYPAARFEWTTITII